MIKFILKYVKSNKFKNNVLTPTDINFFLEKRNVWFFFDNKNYTQNLLLNYYHDSFRYCATMNFFSKIKYAQVISCRFLLNK